jgi:hypothetical protein
MMIRSFVSYVVVAGVVGTASAQVSLLADLRRVESGATAQSNGALNSKFDVALPPTLYDFWPGTSASSINVGGASGSGFANQDSFMTPTMLSATGDVQARGSLSGANFGNGVGKSTYIADFRVDSWVQIDLTGTLGLAATRARQEVSILFADGSPVFQQTTSGDVNHSGRLAPGNYTFKALAISDSTTGAGRGFTGRTNFDVVATFSATSPCAGDFDLSGGTPDSGDIEAFFTVWLAGGARADVDGSGGTPDSGDVAAFFTAWLAGC